MQHKIYTGLESEQTKKQEREQREEQEAWQNVQPRIGQVFAFDGNQVEHGFYRDKGQRGELAEVVQRPQDGHVGQHVDLEEHIDAHHDLETVERVDGRSVHSIKDGVH